MSHLSLASLSLAAACRTATSDSCVALPLIIMTSANAQRAGANLLASSDVFSTSHLLSTNHNAASIRLGRVYFSRYCRLYYVGVMIVLLAGVAWALTQFGEMPRQKWFVGTVIAVAGLIVGEILGRLVMQGIRKYCSSWVSLGDLILTLICTLGVCYSFWCMSTLSVIIGIVSYQGLLLRTLIQYLRLIVFVKNQEKAQAMVIQVINFSELAQPSRVTRKQPIDAQSVEPSKLHLTEEFDEKDGFVGLAKKPSITPVP